MFEFVWLLLIMIHLLGCYIIFDLLISYLVQHILVCIFTAMNWFAQTPQLYSYQEKGEEADYFVQKRKKKNALEKENVNSGRISVSQIHTTY